jgi:translation elongation factor EF-4
VYFRVIDGSMKKGDKICFMANGKVIKTKHKPHQET